MIAALRPFLVVAPILAGALGCGPRPTARAAMGSAAGRSAAAPPSDRARPAPVATRATTDAVVSGSIGTPSPRAADRPDDPASGSARRSVAGNDTPTAPAPALPAFPPPDFDPPFAKSAASGDGHWTPLGDAAQGERAATPAPVLARTVVHPHPDSRWITVTIAAVDLRAVRVGWTAGTEDLSWAKLPVTPASGLVPEADRDALIAVMNGGFQPKHGRWGVAGGGATLTAPRPDGCTLALYQDGSVRLASWPDLAPDAAHMSVIRQTPPCLVERGVLTPALLAGRDRAWAGHATDLQTRRRSAVGLDRAGSTLFYAIGEEADPRWLAEGLRAAGAEAAAQLDINWYWTRFLLFGALGAEPLHVTSTLIPKMEHSPTGYVERPSTRDFFYLVRGR